MHAGTITCIAFAPESGCRAVLHQQLGVMSTVAVVRGVYLQYMGQNSHGSPEYCDSGSDMNCHHTASKEHRPKRIEVDFAEFVSVKYHMVIALGPTHFRLSALVLLIGSWVPVVFIQRPNQMHTTAADWQL